MFGSEKKPKERGRFIVTHEQRLEKTLGMGALQILVDTETGVNYINTVGEGYSGITPLLDTDGRVIVSHPSEYDTQD
ncbi:MAG: hypothetical protein J6U16_06290 [Ruminococcus sp.]|nr:hypothetical protein [Ruminococcus sp.]